MKSYLQTATEDNSPTTVVPVYYRKENYKDDNIIIIKITK